ncbi:hypothetical protein OK344_05050 [Kaistella sp. BT6-1-3]|uniref:Uncharacterized protein n=1 Tax=Kaistella yananensis TaxID=2989820 RepID=A0ABT3JLH3_9FLAO|nr:hypothetical protein [Kaistella yananensis]MCW4451571.1 hypothetical protein [Kaistella yananensis]
MTGIGVVLIGIGIPFAIAANKNAKKALEIENGGATAFKPYFRVETAGTGMALSYNLKKILSLKIGGIFFRLFVFNPDLHSPDRSGILLRSEAQQKI